MTDTIQRRAFWLLLGLTLIAYALPWMQHPAVAMSMGAYDLAEWTSLHPLARSSTPQLFATFLLRLPPVFIALASAVSPLPKLSRFIIIGILAVGLLPPFEFFVSGLDDPNYRQQFFLALFTAISGAIAIMFLSKWRTSVVVGLMLLMMFTSILGMIIASGYVAALHITATIGAGIILMLVVTPGFILWLLWKKTE